MKARLRQISAFLLVVSMLLSPQMAVMADESPDYATPVIEDELDESTDIQKEDNESSDELNSRNDEDNADQGTEDDADSLLDDSDSGEESNNDDTDLLQKEPDADEENDQATEDDSESLLNESDADEDNDQVTEDDSESSDADDQENAAEQDEKSFSDSTDESDKDSEEKKDDQEKDDAPDSSVMRTSLMNVGPQSVSGAGNVGSIVYDLDAATLSFRVTLFPGFTAAAADEIQVEVESWGDGTITLGGLLSIHNAPQIAVSYTYSDNDNTIIHISFLEDVSVAGSPLFLDLELAASATWQACTGSVNDYSQSMQVSIWGIANISGYSAQSVSGEQCPGVGAPVLTSVYHDFEDGMLIFEIGLPQSVQAGQEVTITWPTSQLSLPVGETFQYFAVNSVYDWVPYAEVVVGDGIITFTITADVELASWYYYERIEIPATVNLTCEQGVYIAETGDMTFEGNPGGTYVADSSRVICNAAPASKTGEWVENGGDPYILWTIDTGDVFSGITVSDWGYDDQFLFECYPEVSEYPGVTPSVDCYVDEIYGYSYFNVTLYGDGIVRAVITAKAYPTANLTSYVNCAEISMRSVARSDATGWGGEACFELFPGDGGDFITKSVDKSIVQSGDTVTYTVQAWTTTDRWTSLTMTDVLPDQFTLDESSITCSVEPVANESNPCYSYLSDTNTLQVNALPTWVEMTNGEYEWTELVGSPAVITLTFSGTVEGAAGDVIANNACSLRLDEPDSDKITTASMGDQSIVGGGTICDNAVTTIIGVIELEPVQFVDATCDMDPQVPLPENSENITYTREGDVVPGATVYVHADIDPAKYIWGDLAGTGWEIDEATPGRATATFVIDDPDCSSDVIPDVIAFVDATCDVVPQVPLPENTEAIMYSREGDVVVGATVLVHAEIDLTKHAWGDLSGTGWVVDEASPQRATMTFAIADPDCRLVVVPVVTFTEASCADPAALETESVDGVSYAISGEIGAGEAVTVTATIDLATHQWGDLTGTGWTPGADGSTVDLAHVFAATPDCSSPTPTNTPAPIPTETPDPTSTPSPTEPAPTVPSPTEPAPTEPAPTEPAPTGTVTPTTPTPTATTAVTGLPSTGAGGTGTAWQLLTAALVASVVVAGLGIRKVQPRK